MTYGILFVMSSVAYWILLVNQAYQKQDFRKKEPSAKDWILFFFWGILPLYTGLVLMAIG